MRIKINTRLIAGFLMVILLMIILAFYSLNVTQQSLQESVGKSSVLLAEEMLKRIDQGIHFKINALQRHSKHLLLQRTLSESNRKFEKLDSIDEYMKQRDREWVSVPKDEITPFMQVLISNDLSKSLRQEYIEFYIRDHGYRIFTEFIVTNKFGANVAQTGKTSDYRQDGEPWWQIAKEGGLYVGNVEYDKGTEIHAVDIGVRVDDEKGNFIGVIKAVLDIKRIIREAEILTKRFETTEIKLITHDGKLIYATKAFKFLEDVSEKEFFNRIMANSGYFIAQEGGIEKLFSYIHSKGYRNFRGLGWILVVGHDVGEILQSSFILRNSVAFASLILIAISIVIAFFISRSITDPIVRLSRGAEIIGEGDLTHRVDLKSKDEIGELAVAFNQMTERRQGVEEALRERQQLLKRTLDSLHDAVFIIDANTVEIMDCNPSASEIFGYSHDELLGQTTTFLHVDQAALEEFRRHLYPAIEERGFLSYLEFRMKRKDGTIFPTEHSVMPLEDENGNRTGWVSVVRDISERKRAEEALKVSAMEWRVSFDAISDTVCLLDPQGRIVRCNKAMTKFLAKPPSQIIGRTCYELIYGKSEPIEGCPIVRMRETRRRETLVLPIDDRWFNVSVDPLVDEADNLIGAVHIITDITERKLMEERIQETNKRLQALIHTIPDLVYFKDIYGHNLIINKAFEKFVGLPQEKIIGKTDEKLLPPELAEHCRKSDEEVMKSGKLIRAEEQTTDSNGKKIVFDTFKVPILDNRGNALGLVGVSRDITERKRDEEELRSSREQLRNLSTHLQSVREEERSRIAREIHDELGQTLVAIKMDLFWLGNKLPKDQKTLLKRTKSMTKLVDMTLQKVQRISTELRPGLLDHLGLMAAIEWQTKEFQDRTGIETESTYSPEDIILDRDRSTAMFRIFQETLTNVARHANATRIEVSLKEKAGTLKLKVIDNGRGITKKQISDPQSFGLIGMRERVHHWGGEVKISGIQDKGTTVIVSIPFTKDEKFEDRNIHH